MRRRGSKWDCVLTRESAGLRSFIFFSCLWLARSVLLVRALRVRFFRILRLRRTRSLSVPSDTNCLLPNLIRNFRRRGNLTSFLFSLARSYACSFVRALRFSLGGPLVGLSFPGFFYPRSTRPSQLINLSRCLVVRTPRYYYCRLLATSSRSKLLREERYIKRGAWKKSTRWERDKEKKKRRREGRRQIGPAELLAVDGPRRLSAASVVHVTGS